MAALVNGFLIGQMLASRKAAGLETEQVHVVPKETVQRRLVRAGERTVLEVSTTGLVEVILYEHMGDSQELAQFQAGQVPRSAKVFTQVRQLGYPLSSVSGSEFYARLRPLRPGQTQLRYRPGTVDDAMARLRKGHPLVRNHGTVVVDGRFTAPIYQLVPGTVVRLEVRSGKGLVAVLKTRDFLEVRDERIALTTRCLPAWCVDTASGRAVLELPVADYDDRYLVAEGEDLVFTYQVVATPEMLNYISSCT